MLGFGPLAAFPLAALPTSGNYASPGAIIFHGSNAVPNQVTPNSGRLLFGGGMAVGLTAAPRVTWLGFEVAHPGQPAVRLTWEGYEVLRTVATQPTIDQVTWIGIEVAHPGAATERVSWLGAEVAHVGAARERVSWIGVEVLRTVADRRASSGYVYLIC